MYKISTVFIKAQLPRTSVTELLEFYKEEFEDQSVSKIQIEGSSLMFFNNNLKYVGNRYANKFSGFNSGRLNIADTDSEYLVTFEAENSRPLIIGGIIAGGVTLLALFATNFALSSLLIGIIIFAVLSIIGYTVTMVSFPVYFTAVRNNIESRLRSRQHSNR